MRLIDADAVLTIIEEIKLNKDIPKNYGTLLDISRKIRQLPTVDAAPVVHAHWIQKGFDCECSNCGSLNGAFGVKYCQDCGAKMDEEAETE